jgi:hypothetical protein
MKATHRIEDLWSDRWGIRALDVRADHSCDEQCEADECPSERWDCTPEGVTGLVEIAGEWYPRGVFMTWDDVVERWGAHECERVRSAVRNRYSYCEAY